MQNLKAAPPTPSCQPSTVALPNSTRRQALILRCQKILFSAYRADQYADAEGFITSLGAVLEQFPDEVITYISDPRTGIQRRSKWPPTISEVIDACEDHQGHLARVRAPRPIFKSAPRQDLRDLSPGSLARIFVPEGHNRYADLVEWTSRADRAMWKFGPSSDSRPGVWVSHEAWNDPKSTKPEKAS